MARHDVGAWRMHDGGRLARGGAPRARGGAGGNGRGGEGCGALGAAALLPRLRGRARGEDASRQVGGACTKVASSWRRVQGARCDRCANAWLGQLARFCQRQWTGAQCTCLVARLGRRASKNSRNSLRMSHLSARRRAAERRRRRARRAARGAAAARRREPRARGRTRVGPSGGAPHPPSAHATGCSLHLPPPHRHAPAATRLHPLFSFRLREGRTARMLFVGAPAAGRRAVAGARRTGVRLGRAVHGAAGAAPGAGGGSGRPGGKSSGHQGGDASGLPRAVPRARCSASRRRRAPGGQQP